jgi:hypothetical protein
MVRHALIRRVLVLGLGFVVACGGGKKSSTTPIDKTNTTAKEAAPPETEADREKKRHDLSVAIVPEGSTCLPVALKDDNAPRLEFAAIGKDLVVCANDTDRTRLLGPVGCWKVAVDTGALTYQDPTPLPGVNIDVQLDDRCARTLCLPNDAKLGDDKLAHMSWNSDGTKVAVLVGDDVHLFDGSTKAHESTFSVKGDKGVSNDPVAVHFVGDAIFVEGEDKGGSFRAVWQFKPDGTAVGPLVGIGVKDGKPLSIYHGSFSMLDGDHVGLADHGLETMTSFEVSTGKRIKAVRKLGKTACKPDEVETFWKDGDKVSDKCRGSMASLYSPYISATGVMGRKSLVLMYRDDRLGELGLLDPKTLAEKSVLKMAWCDKAEKPSSESAAKPDAKKSDGSKSKSDDE